ncbi:MAG: DUF4397 domain-containing protein [Candidatus Bipolaricaulota bacterium]
MEKNTGQLVKNWHLPAVVLVLILVLAGFSLHGAGAESKVRFLHLAPGTGPVEVWLDGRLIEEDLHYGSFTDYLELTPENHRVICKRKGSLSPKVINQLLPLREEKEYSLVLTSRGGEDDQQLEYLIDNCPPSRSLAQLKFMNAVPNYPPLTLSIKYGPTLYQGLAFRTNGGCKFIPPGDYVLRLTETNTGNLITEKKITFESGTRYNIFANQRGEDEGVDFLTLEKTNVPEEPPKVFGIEESVLHLFGAGILASLIILLIA